MLLRSDCSKLIDRLVRFSGGVVNDRDVNDVIHTVHWHAIDFTQECAIFPEDVEVVMSASRNGPPCSY